MRIELWQVPVLVMAGIIVVEFAGRLVLRWRRITISAAQARFVVNAAILAGLLVFFAIGFSQKDAAPADRFVTVVTGAMNVGMTYWTYQAFRSTKHASRSGNNRAVAEHRNARDPEDAKSGSPGIGAGSGLDSSI